MAQFHFIYGNQSLELEEAANELIKNLIPDAKLNESFFCFDIEDFFSKDQNQNKIVLSEFKSTCETVSFFSPVILIYLKNLQNVPKMKSQKKPLEKELGNINLIKTEISGEMAWVDNDSLLEPIKTHFHVTGKQIVQKVVEYEKKSYALQLDETWNNNIVLIQKGKDFNTVTIKEFLRWKLNKDITFDPVESVNIQTPVTDNDTVKLLCDYLESPPPQVEFLFTANIRNTRELNQTLYKSINRHAKEIKKTIAYDDFRPVNWVMERSKKKNIPMDHNLADLLIEIAGSDFNTLDMELEKLSILKKGQPVLLPEDLISSVSHSKVFTIFRITDFLIKKDLKNSLESLNLVLKENPSDVIYVFSIIVSQFRKALRIGWMLDSGLPERSIIDSLKLNQWIGKQLIKQIRQFNILELENILIHLSKCDLQLKFSAKDSISILENVCYLICNNEFSSNKPIALHWVP